jgi:hypothetical protein
MLRLEPNRVAVPIIVSALMALLEPPFNNNTHRSFHFHDGESIQLGLVLR